MNETSSTIVIVGCISGALGASFAAGGLEPQGWGSLEIQAGNTESKPSVLARPMSKRRIVIGFIVFSLLVIVWGLMFGAVLAVGIWDHPRANSPKGEESDRASFCEACGNWYGRRKHLGGTAHANESTLLDLIRQKDFAGLSALMEPNAELPSVEVYFQGCQVFGKSPSPLMVRNAFQNAKGDLRFTDASQTILQLTESALLLSPDPDQF